MKITAIDPQTGLEISQEVNTLSPDFLTFIDQHEFTDSQIEKLINRLDISADAKQILAGLAKATVTIGKAIVRIGRKLIDLFLHLYKNFPNMTFGAIVAIILGALIFAIPIIGPIITAIASPILLILGISLGSYKDLTCDASRHVDIIFSPLRQNT